MEMMVWNFVLTVLVGLVAFVAKGKIDELDRITILLNKTREEIARDHVTRAEMTAVADKLGDRFDRGFERLEIKIDALVQKN